MTIQKFTQKSPVSQDFNIERTGTMNKNLILSIIFAAIALFCFVEFCNAETTVNLYALRVEDDMGFEGGFSAKVEPRYRIYGTEFLAYYQYEDVHKEGHDSGYLHRYGGGVRQFLYTDFFIGAVYQWVGYETEGNGEKWNKKTGKPVLSAGYAGHHGELSLSYMPKDDTVNEVSAVGLLGKFRFKDGWHAYFQTMFTRFKQAGEKMEGNTIEFGCVYEFMVF